MFRNTCTFALVSLFSMVGNAAAAEPDVFDSLRSRFVPFSYARTALSKKVKNVDELNVPLNAFVGEYHVAYEPPLAGPASVNFSLPSGAAGAANHPMSGTLIQLVDSAPAGAWIRVSVYMFSNVHIKDALVRAIQRGVIVRVITTNYAHISDHDRDLGLDDASADSVNANIVRTDLENAISYRRNNTGWIDDNLVVVCDKQRAGHSEDEGGCISSRLNHNKFMTLSRVCRFGLSSSNSCAASKDSNSKQYEDVVAQGSYNYTNAPRHAHEIITVMFGRPDLYNDYTSYFNKQVALSSDHSDNSFFFQKVVDFSATSGVLEMNGMPRARDFSSDSAYAYSDVVIKHLHAVMCARKPFDPNPTSTVRVAVAHWSGDVGMRMVKTLETLRNNGCTVRLLVKNGLPTDASSAPVYAAMKAAGLEVRIIKSSTNLKANLHAKYITVDNPVVPAKRVLMFGTLSFTNASQMENDEMWNVWNNPDQVGFEFYKATFDALWQNAALK